MLKPKPPSDDDYDPLYDESLPLEERRRLGVEKARQSMDAGWGIPGEEIKAWIDSWGTKDELPPPRARRLS